MPLLSFLKGRYVAAQQKRAKRQILEQETASEPEIKCSDWPSSLVAPSEFYLKCFRYFHSKLPSDLKEHRGYFSKSRRGFGEDAFHTMWFFLFQQYRPSNFLEIGVYRGQTLTLSALLQQKNGMQPDVTGISPFQPAGDSVTKYRKDVNYLQDTLTNFDYFHLPKPTLIQAYSTDAVAVDRIASRSWDCIYIDGNHDYEVVKADWSICSQHVKTGGLIVLDDSGLTTNYQPPVFSTKGHPGPSRLAQEVDRAQFREILQVGHNRVFQNIGA